MSIGGKLGQMTLSDPICDPVVPGRADPSVDDPVVATRRAVIEESLLKQRILDRLGTPHIFLFETATLLHRTGAPAPAAVLADDILRKQALRLAAHTVTLHTGLAIDDIYAHPLLRPSDILFGHRMRAFIAVPIRDAARELVGVVCGADRITRRWSGSDIGAMQRIVAQFEALRLSQS